MQNATNDPGGIMFAAFCIRARADREAPEALAPARARTDREAPVPRLCPHRREARARPRPTARAAPACRAAPARHARARCPVPAPPM
jgi:hypothetical protein